MPQTRIIQGFLGSEDSGRVRCIPDASGEVEGSKSAVRKDVWVRLPPSAPSKIKASVFSGGIFIIITVLNL